MLDTKLLSRSKVPSIYVVKSDVGPVKIGISSRPLTRLSGLRTSSPSSLSLEFLAACSDSAAIDDIEAIAHDILKAYRQNGEWFITTVGNAIGAIRQAARQRGCLLMPLSVTDSREWARPQIKIKRPDDVADDDIASPRHHALRKLLHERRIKAALSQEELARRLGVSQSTVSAIERGDQRVTVIQYLDWAEALGFDARSALRRVASASRE